MVNNTVQHTWMQLYPSGAAFNPLSPEEDDIHISDIAHALSNTCRYGGHVRSFYSVAEHCVLIARWLLAEGHGPKIAMAGLLHDATEAYMADLIRPIKKVVVGYQEAEEVLGSAIIHRFGLDLRYWCPRKVREADLRIVVDEKRALLAAEPQPWSALAGVEPLGVVVQAMPPIAARIAYLNLFEELY